MGVEGPQIDGCLGMHSRCGRGAARCGHGDEPLDTGVAGAMILTQSVEITEACTACVAL